MSVYFTDKSVEEPTVHSRAVKEIDKNENSRDMI